jgi:hypothetical protein
MKLFFIILIEIIILTIVSHGIDARFCNPHDNCPENQLCFKLNLTCICKEGYKNISNFCVRDGCSNAYDCGRHEICINRQCTCDSSHLKDIDGKCSIKTCHSDSDCGWNSRCRSLDRCECYTNYYYDLKEDKCIYQYTTRTSVWVWVWVFFIIPIGIAIGIAYCIRRRRMLAHYHHHHHHQPATITVVRY